MEQNNSLQQYFDAYIREREFSSRLSAETMRGYKEVFKLFTLIMPEVQDVTFLSPEILIEFFKRLQTRQRLVGKSTFKTGVTASTILTYWSRLNTFFAWLKTKAIIKINPLENIKPPQPSYKDKLTLSDIEIRTLYSAIILHNTNLLRLRRDTAMISLLLFCGLRLGEFISLQVNDIDFEKQLLTVRGTTSKSKRIRHIPIHPTLLFHLKDYISERNKRKYKTQYLIVSSHSDKVLSRDGLKDWVKNLSKTSGVKFHLHRFRHAFACNLAEKDVNAVKIQKLLGHSSLNMTMTYLRSMRPEDLQDDVNKLSF